jgi:glycerophosphoryl diester phosphodiesterase
MAKPCWPFPRVFAHRGGGNLAPENTLAGIRAAAYGCAAVEFDVQLAACGTAVLIHDATLERTTNGSGRVCDATYAQIATLDAGQWFSPAFKGERVPTLEEAIELCMRLGLHANVEIKAESGSGADAGSSIAAMVLRLWRNRRQRPLLSSFSEAVLEGACRAAPGLPRGLLVTEIGSGWRRAMTRLDCLSLHCDERALGSREIADLIRHQVLLLAYTVNRASRAEELWRHGVAAVVTDNLCELCRENDTAVGALTPYRDRSPRKT